MPHSLCVVTNKIHQNRDFSQVLSHAHSAQVSDVIPRFHSLFSNFRNPGPKIPNYLKLSFIYNYITLTNNIEISKPKIKVKKFSVDMCNI